MPVLHERLIKADIIATDFSEHSFWKDVAQYNVDQSTLDESIQPLGKCTSNGFQLYFQTSPGTFYNLNLSFQKGIPMVVPLAELDLISKSQQLINQRMMVLTYFSPNLTL